MGGRGSIGLAAAVCLASACLAAPPDAADLGAAGGPDAAATAACGEVHVDVAYMSRFDVDPDGYGRAGLDRVGLVINSGSSSVDLGALEVLEVTVDDIGSALVFAASERGGTLAPGEARGELSRSGREMVLARLSEPWIDQESPELSGLLTTSRSTGSLHGTVLLALGPHRLSLDLELDLTTFQGSGAYPRDARRVSSTCADGS